MQDFGPHQEFKILEPHEGAGKQMIAEIELGESEINAGHGEVIIDQEENKAGNQEQKQDPVPPEFL